MWWRDCEEGVVIELTSLHHTERKRHASDFTLRPSRYPHHPHLSRTRHPFRSSHHETYLLRHQRRRHDISTQTIYRGSFRFPGQLQSFRFHRSSRECRRECSRCSYSTCSRYLGKRDFTAYRSRFWIAHKEGFLFRVHDSSIDFGEIG